MRTVCRRLKSDHRYTITNVYNNFPCPTPTDEQRTKIEQTSQASQDARALYPYCNLADPCDKVTMPPREFCKANQKNDRAIIFGIKTTAETTCAAELIMRYQQMTEK